MANNTIWIEKFKISTDLKAEFENSSPKDKSFLVWCLENGHLKERDYLSWASEEFQLPVVSETFFASDDAREAWLSTWSASRDLYQWNQSLLPLDESTGVVRVGCLEVPELNLNKPVAYVLAPLSGMRSLWNQAQEETAPAVPVEQAEEPTKPQFISIPSSPEVIAAPAPEAAAPAFDVPPAPPQEFDANSLMASWGSPDESSELPPEPEAEIHSEEPSQMPDGFAMPEGFSVSDIPVPQVQVVAPPSESAVNIPIPQVDIPMPVLAPPPVVAAQPPPPPVVVETQLPPPVPEVVEQPAPVQTIVAKAKPPIPPMAPAAPGKAVGDYVGMIDLRNPKDRLSDCHDLSEVANFAFAKFSRYFDRHMILLMKGFELRPHAWAGSWNLRSARPASINLDQPSIFRIASRTKLPYHGYTKPSVANDIFFAEWSNSAAPAHVTLMPLIVNDQLVGMILGATDGSLDTKVALAEVERWTVELAPHVARTKSIAPKAAA